MGRGCGADRRGDPGGTSGQGGWHDAVGLADRLGCGRPDRDAVLYRIFAGGGLARAFLVWAVPGAPRLLRASVRQRTAGLRANSSKSAGSRQEGELPRDFLADHSEDHDTDLPALDRRAGRLLFDHHVAANFPAYRAQAYGSGDRRIPWRHYHRLVDWRLDQRMVERSDRTSCQLHSVRGLLDPDGFRLYPDPRGRYHDAVPRLSARLFLSGRFFRNGAVPDRAFPDPHARLWPRLRVQFWAWHRGDEPTVRWHAQRDVSARTVHRCVRRHCVWPAHRRRFIVAGDQGAAADRR